MRLNVGSHTILAGLFNDIPSTVNLCLKENCTSHADKNHSILIHNRKDLIGDDKLRKEEEAGTGEPTCASTIRLECLFLRRLLVERRWRTPAQAAIGLLSSRSIMTCSLIAAHPAAVRCAVVASLPEIFAPSAVSVHPQESSAGHHSTKSHQSIRARDPKDRTR